MKKKNNQNTLFEIMSSRSEGKTPSNEAKIIPLQRQEEPTPETEAANAPEPVAGGGGNNPRAISLRIDMAAVLLFGVGVLMALAFVLGRSTAPGAVSDSNPAAASMNAGYSSPIQPRSAGTASSRSSRTAPREAALPAAGEYTIQAATYLVSDKKTALDTVKFLKTKFSNVFWKQTSQRHLVVYVGRFENKDDPAALKELSRLKNLSTRTGKKYFKTAYIIKMR